jgi:RNA polymerase sigma-70 factor (ECF subfamily)
MTDEELMRAYVAGDPSAFETIFRRHAPRLRGWILKMVRSPEEANDILQQAFLHLHRARYSFDQSAVLRSWLYTIALNCVRQRVRYRGRRREVSIDETRIEAFAWDTDPAVVEHQRLRRERVRSAIDRLTGLERQVIEMHWFEERSFPEVARILGASLSAVKLRAHRGYVKLRAHLGTREQGRRACSPA